MYGNRIRKLRKAKGWTQEDLAYEAGVSPTHIGRLENDASDFKMATIRKLEAVLGPIVAEPAMGDDILSLKNEKLRDLSADQKIKLEKLMNLAIDIAYGTSYSEDPR